MDDEGSTLAGRYNVTDTLGRGGMGLVVKATHIQLGTPVAIKLLRGEALEDPAMVERFLREARSAARLRGEHVCRVTDFGTTDVGVPFMVMEYLEGEDLATMLDHGGAFDVQRAATYVLQACIAVAEAHSLGIIHRDLKPGNLMLTRGPDGRQIIKLLDFGIAKSTAHMDASLTATSKAMGSPAYMSPEQLRAHSTIDPRSDVWSLGVTLFELLTEKRPFEGDTPYELALTISNDPAVPLPDTVPAEMAKIVMRCLEKDRERRYKDVAELAAALAPLAKGGRDLAGSVRAALTPNAPKERVRAIRDADPQTETTMRGASGAIDAEAPRKKLPAHLILFAVLGLGLAALAIFVWWPRDGSTGSVPAAIPGPAPQPQPQPQPPPPPTAEVVPDAAVVEVDAAEVAMPPDAAETVAPPDGPAKPPKKRPRKPPKSGEPDFGNSRF